MRKSHTHTTIAGIFFNELTVIGRGKGCTRLKKDLQLKSCYRGKVVKVIECT